MYTNTGWNINNYRPYAHRHKHRRGHREIFDNLVALHLALWAKNRIRLLGD